MNSRTTSTTMPAILQAILLVLLLTLFSTSMHLALKRTQAPMLTIVIMKSIPSMNVQSTTLMRITHPLTLLIATIRRITWQNNWVSTIWALSQKSMTLVIHQLLQSHQRNKCIMALQKMSIKSIIQLNSSVFKKTVMENTNP